MQIREAEPSDIGRLSEVVKQSWLEAYSGIQSEEELEKIRANEDFYNFEGMEESMKSEDTVFLITESEEDIIGQMIFAWGDERHDHMQKEGVIQLRSTYVHPDYWGEGVGTKMFEEGMERISGGFDKLKVEVLKDNDIGISFYRKQGFEKADEYKLPADNLEFLDQDYPTIIMEREV